MQVTLAVLSATALALLAISCGGSPAAPLAAPSPSVDLAGTWDGTGVDSQGATTVTWALRQTGTSVSGTVATKSADADGSCNSCHRNKTGTFSGTIAGTTLALTIFFAAGVDGDPTPACTATLTGTATSTVADMLTTAYSGADSCEGQFLNGTLVMARHR